MTDEASVRLNPVVTTYVAAFEAALRAARSASLDEQAQRLEEAAVLYRGELLPGYHDGWVFQEWQRLGEAFTAALNQLIALHEGAGDRHGAIHWARRAVVVDPLREETHHALIGLLLATDQSQAARDRYSAP